MSFVVFHKNPVDGEISLLILSQEDEANTVSNKMQAAGRKAFFAACGDDIYLQHDPIPMHCLTVDFDAKTWGWDVEKYRQECLLNQLSTLAKATDMAFNPILSTYSQAEMQSWSAQEAEAVAWLADNSTPTPTLDALNPRETKVHFCQLVINKAAVFKQSLTIVGISQRIRDDLHAMPLDALIAASPTQLLTAEIDALTQGAQ